MGEKPEFFSIFFAEIRWNLISARWSWLFAVWKSPKKSSGYPLFKISGEKIGFFTHISFAKSDILYTIFLTHLPSYLRTNEGTNIYNTYLFLTCNRDTTTSLFCITNWRAMKMRATARSSCWRRWTRETGFHRVTLNKHGGCRHSDSTDVFSLWMCHETTGAYEKR